MFPVVFYVIDEMSILTSVGRDGEHSFDEAIVGCYNHRHVM